MNSRPAPEIKKVRLAIALSLTVALVNTTVLGVPTIVLSIGFAVSAWIWVQREWHPSPGLLWLVGIGIGIQTLHFAEELLTGFAEQFPALFGTQWELSRFCSFNLGWLTLFALTAFGVARGKQIAFLGVLFFALVAGIGNGAGHILLSLRAGRIFPGTFTAPFLILVGGFIMKRLFSSATSKAETTF